MDIRPAPLTQKHVANPVERDTTAPAMPSAAARATEAKQGDAITAADAEADLQQSVDRINQSLSASNQGIEFAVDEDSERVVVKIVDRETREVLRQMPTKEALEIAKALDRTQGLLIRQEA